VGWGDKARAQSRQAKRKAAADRSKKRSEQIRGTPDNPDKGGPSPIVGGGRRTQGKRCLHDWKTIKSTKRYIVEKCQVCGIEHTETAGIIDYLYCAALLKE